MEIVLSDFEDASAGRTRWPTRMPSERNTKEAPWYIVPADRKWFRNLAVSQILVDMLEALDMRFCRRRSIPANRMDSGLRLG